MKKIISKNNEFIKSLKRQKDNRFLLFLDNPKTIFEALKSGLKLQNLLITEENIPKFINFQNAIIVPMSIIKEFTSATTPQGIIAVFEFNKQSLSAPKGNYLVLDGVQDSGNVGTILRSALGANFLDVYLINSAKLSSEKVVRSSMGAIFRLNTYEITKDDFIAFAQKNNLILTSADMTGENIFTAKSFNQPIGLVLGSEGQGISLEIKFLCKNSLSIPMANNLESLNVGVAGSLLMLEINNKKGE